MTTTDDDDIHHMCAALALARRGLGVVWPNPAVGCVIVGAGGRVVGRGWTQPGGRPHAETEALGRAAGAARGATAYVTLEPCDHAGRTPSCAGALIDAGIGRAVIAAGDPDPRVSGRGLDRLRDAGIEVVLGVCDGAAERVNVGFFTRVTRGRPLFTLKTASTLDGRIATAKGASKWITGPEARMLGHRLRAEHDAVLIGVGTALADDPLLTCRLPGLEDRSPLRIVVDSHLRLAPESRLALTAGTTPTWAVAAEGAPADRRRALEALGVTVIEIEPGGDGRPRLDSLAAELGRRGLTRVLVEGGAVLTAALVGAGLADRLAWFRNPRLIGGDGVPAVAGLGVEALDEAPAFVRMAVATSGADTMETYVRVVED